MWSCWSLLSSFAPLVFKNWNSTCPPCFHGFSFFMMMKWYLRDTYNSALKLQGTLKKCVCVCLCVCVCARARSRAENPLSLCFSISFLRKIRLFKSHYAQLSSVLPKPLYSITSSKSEKGGESGYCRRWGLQFFHIHFTLWNSKILSTYISGSFLTVSAV